MHTEVLIRLQRSHRFAWHNRGFIVLMALVIAIAAMPIQQTHAHNKPLGNRPWPTQSAYALTVDASPVGAWRQAGEAQGERSTNDPAGSPYPNYTSGNARPYNGVVVLDFGAQVIQGGAWGTKLIPPASIFVTNGQIAEAVKQYIWGFYYHTPALYRDPPLLRVAIGTNNSDTGTGVNAYQAGASWGQLVNDLSNWVQSQSGLSSQISIAGANDIEGSRPTWLTSYTTRQWTSGYASTGQHTFYNYGAASGCYPASGGATDVCSYDEYGNVDWRQSDYWYVSRGATYARAIPEIYYGGSATTPVDVNAKQWQKLSLWGYTTYGGSNWLINTSGEMTQSLSCGNCHNWPEEGWTQLQNQLYNNDPGYHGTDPSQNWCTSPSVGTCHRTDFPVGWSTDIGYVPP